jgi:hypothetical protein
MICEFLTSFAPATRIRPAGRKSGPISLRPPSPSSGRRPDPAQPTFARSGRREFEA